MPLLSSPAGTTVRDVTVETKATGECELTRPDLVASGAAHRLVIPENLPAGPVLRLAARLRVKGVHVLLTD